MIKHTRHRLLFVFLAISLVGGAVVAWKLWPRQRSYVTDARNIRKPAESVQVRDILWDTPVPADTLLDLTNGSTDFAMDAEQRLLVFVDGQGVEANIFERRRNGNRWEPPIKLASVNSAHVERDVALSPNGQILLFASDRPGVAGGFDLFKSTRDDDGWSEPIPLVNANSTADEMGPTLAANNTLFFSSNRVQAEDDVGVQSDTEIETTTDRQHTAAAARSTSYNLFATTLGAVSAPRPIPAANSPAHELSPSLSPMGDFLYFASDRPQGAGGFDLYRIRVLIDGFGSLEPLDDSINTIADELDPFLSLGGFQLIYRTTRSTTNDEAATNTLMQATSREVFREIAFERGQIDWWALWRQIGPNLLWAGFALLLALLFFALIRDFRDKQVSLLARCLVFSLFVHMLLMLAFNLLQVTTTIASSLGESGGVHVTLTSTANAGEIGQQVRGDFVDTPAFEFSMPSEPPPKLAAAKVALPEQLELAPQRSASNLTENTTTHATIEFASREPTSDAVAMPRRSQKMPSLPTAARPQFSENIQTPHVSPAATTTESTPQPPLDQFETESFTQPSAPSLKVSTETPAPFTEVTPVTAQTVNDVAGEVKVEAQFLKLSNDQAPDLELSNTVTAPQLPLNTPTVASLHETQLALPHAAPNPVQPEPAPPVAAANATTTGKLALPALKIANASDWKLYESQVEPTRPAMRDKASNESISVNTKSHQGDLAMPRGPRKELPPLASPTTMRMPNVTGPGTTDSNNKKPITEEPQPRINIPSAPMGAARPTLAGILPNPKSGNMVLADIKPRHNDEWMTSAARPTDADIDNSNRPPVETEWPIEASVASLPSTNSPLAVNLPSAASEHRPRLRGLGRIAGRVVNAEDGSGMARAQVRLTLPEDASVIVDTDETGSYVLDVPPGVPDHFALSATSEGFVPESVNIPRRRVEKQTLDVNFALSRVTELVVALEDEPDVHHLGNDRFEGRINSQFQKRSEGRTFRATFNISRAQLPPNFSRAEVVMLVKGVQCPHQVRINSRLVSDWLSSSPRDGSFGEYRAAFTPDWLVEGKNRFKIRARSCGGDLDDFEFVNIRIRLLP